MNHPTDFTMQQIDFDKIQTWCRGDTQRYVRHLSTFVKLIPPRIDEIQTVVANNEPQELKALVHKMHPQLVFFGLESIASALNRIVLEFISTNKVEQNTLHEHLTKLTQAVEEVQQTIDSLS